MIGWAIFGMVIGLGLIFFVIILSITSSKGVDRTTTRKTWLLHKDPDTKRFRIVPLKQTLLEKDAIHKTEGEYDVVYAKSGMKKLEIKLEPGYLVDDEDRYNRIVYSKGLLEHIQGILCKNNERLETENLQLGGLVSELQARINEYDTKFGDKLQKELTKIAEHQNKMTPFVPQKKK